MAQNINLLAEYALKLLVANPSDPITRTRQKALAQFLDSHKKFVNVTQPKLKDLLMQIVKLHSEYFEIDGHIIKENIKFENFEEFKDLLESNRTVTTDEVDTVLKQLRNRVIASKILKESDKLQDILDSLPNLPTYDQIVSKYKEVITSSYMELVDAVPEENEIDLVNRDISESLDYLIEMSKQQLSVPTGFQNLNRLLHSGGFESNRLYLFAGKPGAGKSALLLNLLVNMANIKKKDLHIGDSKPAVVVYITLENDLVETTERLIRLSTGKDIILADLDQRSRQTIINSVKFENGVVIKYMKAYDTTTTDIFLYISKLAERYRIMGVLVDHLSLLSSKERIQERRHDLGHAAAELKVMAIRFGFPVIAAMQLNSAGYKGIPTLVNLDESRQPAQVADFVGLMFEQEYVPEQCSPRVPVINGRFVGINVDKNRNGEKGLLYFIYRGNIFKFSSTDLTYQDFNMQPFVPNGNTSY